MELSGQNGASVADEEAANHVDVLILGAGLSGIGAACHLKRRLPHKSVAILEARDAIGGTWDLFRYPGIRSDSDMFTLGYRLRPWQDPRGIADGPSILSYIHDTAREFDVERLVRFQRRAVNASWNSELGRWSVTCEDTSSGEREEITCSFLFSCTGYYRYDEGFSPAFADQDAFAGAVVHPQHWPEDLDVRDRRIVVIGSGATAVTLVPSLVSDGASHVTMLQRSPTYVVPLPAHDALAVRLQGAMPARAVSWLVRWRNVLRTIVFYHACRRAPALMRKLLARVVRASLPADFDVETHFTPTYDPWDQRVCLAADGDLFEAIREGRADVATAQIERFTEAGIRLQDGRELKADLIVTATGLNLQMFGGMQLDLDGEPVHPGSLIAYKGMMLGGVPNLVMTLGYTNASWTLKSDLVAEHACRLIEHMQQTGADACTPRPRPGETGRPILDLKSGYIMRSLDSLPKQGARPPWRLHQNYVRDIRMLRHGPVDDEMDFSTPVADAKPTAFAAAA